MRTRTYKKRNTEYRPGRASSSRHKQSSGSSSDISRYINEGKKVKPSEPYANVNESFQDFPLSEDLLKLVKEKSYTKPSEIQDKAIQHILDGNDLIGVAGTGTGKTAAFLIPIIQKLIENRQENFALIIAPTRELANQISEEFKSLTYGLQLFSTCLIGGVPVGQSIKNLKKKNHIIVGTPGRLQDMARQRALDFSRFKVLVLDEFDRMLDMGFSTEIQDINKRMVAKEQSLLFSATLDNVKQNLVDEMTHNPIKVQSTKSTQQTGSIDQNVVHTAGKDKYTILEGLLSEPKDAKTILFCETKRLADKIVKKLIENQFRADAIHGNKTQKQREKALGKFRTGKTNILVATDVVARGIDVSDVELVINYQAPKNYNDYIHRIGRTGRAGKEGRAITLID